MSSKDKHYDNTLNQSVNAKTDGWDFVINSGMIQLRELEAQTARLRVSLEYFEKRRVSGSAFPGEQKLKDAGWI